MAEPSKFTDVIYEVRDRAAWIIINRPKVYNAFRGQTVEELIQAFQLAANDRNVSSIVLTGAGEKAFCTGGDQSAHEGQYDGRGIVGLPIEELQGLIRDVPKPVIARVNGFAIGGGNVLATLCDLTIAADTAQFGQVGPKMGCGLGNCVPRPSCRRQESAGNLVHQRPLHRRAGTRDGPCQQGGSRGRTGCRSQGLDRQAGAAVADGDRAGEALVQCRLRQHTRHQQFRAARPEDVLRYAGIEGRRRRLQRKAAARLQQVFVLIYDDDGATTHRVISGARQRHRR